MQKRKKVSLLSIGMLIFASLLFKANSVFALEAKYPDFFGLSINNTSGIAEYARYFFNIITASTISLSAVIVAFGGIYFLVSFAQGKFTDEGKSWIKSGLLGLLIGLSAYLIAFTINPSLVAFRLDQLASLPFQNPLLSGPLGSGAKTYEEIPIGKLTENLLTKTINCYDFDESGDIIEGEETTADNGQKFKLPTNTNKDAKECLSQIIEGAQKTSKETANLAASLTGLMKQCTCDETKCNASGSSCTAKSGVADCCPAGVKNQIEHGPVVNGQQTCAPPPTCKTVDINWQDIYMSSNGRYQVARTPIDGEFGKNYVSDDYGATWFKEDTHRSRSYGLSSNGKVHVSLDNYYSDNASVSYNYGIGWIPAPSSVVKFGGISPNKTLTSSDGKYQITVGNQVYVSSDYGQTWAAKLGYLVSGYGLNSEVVMSSDGKYQSVAISSSSWYGNGYVVSSSDYGQTWIWRIPGQPTMASWGGAFSNLLMSSDGKYLVVLNNIGAYNSTNGFNGNFFISYDHGLTWELITPFGGKDVTFANVKMSGNGQYLLATYGTSDFYDPYPNKDHIFISSNYGKNWTSRKAPFSSFNPPLVGVSHNGTYWSVPSSANDGKVYTSSDAGFSWTAAKDPGDAKWQQVVISSDGKYQTAIGTRPAKLDCPASGFGCTTVAPAQPVMYISGDYGKTWKKSGVCEYDVDTFASNLALEKKDTGTGSTFFVSMALSPDGESAYVASLSKEYANRMIIRKFNTTNLALGQQGFTTADVYSPNIIVSKDNKKAYVVGTQPNIKPPFDTRISVLEFDASNLSAGIINSASSGGSFVGSGYYNPSPVVMSSDGKRIYVSSSTYNLSGSTIKVFDTTNLSLGAIISKDMPGISINSLALSPSEDILYLGTTNYIQKLKASDLSSGAFSVATGVKPSAMRVSPNGEYIYVSDSSLYAESLRKYLSSSFEMVGSIKLNGIIALSPDGKDLYAVNRGITNYSGAATNNSGIMKFDASGFGAVLDFGPSGYGRIYTQVVENSSTAVSPDNKYLYVISNSDTLYSGKGTGIIQRFSFTTGISKSSPLPPPAPPPTDAWGNPITPPASSPSIPTTAPAAPTSSCQPSKQSCNSKGNWQDIGISVDGKYQTIVDNPGKIYVSSDSGESWLPKEPNDKWYAVAISSDGKCQTAIKNTQSGPIYNSCDYGETWNKRMDYISEVHWSELSMSKNGKYQAATNYGEKLYVSADFGQTWTAKESNRNWTSVDMSSDGKYQTAVDRGGKIYVSSDSGQTWTAKEYTASWYAVTMSSDGKYQTAIAIGGKIYVSADFGQTWTAKEFDRNWWDIAMSSDGKYQTAINKDGKIYISKDFGQTWTAKESDRNWEAITMSSGGNYQTAINKTGKIYISNDYGGSWTAKESDRNWTIAGMSSDGKIQTTAEYGGKIYKSSDFGQTWTEKCADGNPSTALIESGNPDCKTTPATGTCEQLNPLPNEHLGLDEFRCPVPMDMPNNIPMQCKNVVTTCTDIAKVVEKTYKLNDKDITVIDKDKWDCLTLVQKLTYFKEQTNKFKDDVKKDSDKLKEATDALGKCYLAVSYIDLFKNRQNNSIGTGIINIEKPFKDPTTNEPIEIAKYCTGFSYGISNNFNTCNNMCPDSSKEALDCYKKCETDPNKASCVNKCYKERPCVFGKTYENFDKCLQGEQKTCNDRCNEKYQPGSNFHKVCKDLCDNSEKCLTDNQSSCLFNDSRAEQFINCSTQNSDEKNTRLCLDQTYMCKDGSDQYSAYPDCVNTSAPEDQCTILPEQYTSSQLFSNPKICQKCPSPFSLATSGSTCYSAGNTNNSCITTCPETTKCLSSSVCPNCPCGKIDSKYQFQFPAPSNFNTACPAGECLDQYGTCSPGNCNSSTPPPQQEVKIGCEYEYIDVALKTYELTAPQCNEHSFNDDPLTFYCEKDWWNNPVKEGQSRTPIGTDKTAPLSKEIPIGQTVDNAQKWAANLIALSETTSKNIQAVIDSTKKSAEAYKTYPVQDYCKCNAQTEGGAALCKPVCDPSDSTPPAPQYHLSDGPVSTTSTGNAPYKVVVASSSSGTALQNKSSLFDRFVSAVKEMFIASTSFAAEPSSSINYAYVALLTDNAWQRFDTDNIQAGALGTSSTIGSPYGITTSPNGEYVYIVSVTSETAYILKYNASNMEIENPYDIGTTNLYPYSVAISPDGNFAYVVTSNQTIQKFDTSNLNAGPVETAGTGLFPFDVAISPDGNYVYVVGWDSKIKRFSASNLLAGATNIGDTGGMVSMQIAISPDGKYAYVSNVFEGKVNKFDVTNPSSTPTAIANISNVNTIALSSDGKSLYVTNTEWDETGNNPKNSINRFNASQLSLGVIDSGPTGGGVSSTDTSPDGYSIYNVDMSGNTIERFNISETLASSEQTTNLSTRPPQLFEYFSSTFANLSPFPQVVYGQTSDASCSNPKCSGNSCQQVIDYMPAVWDANRTLDIYATNAFIALLQDNVRSDALKQLDYSRKEANTCSSVQASNSQVRMLSCSRVQDEQIPPILNQAYIYGGEKYNAYCYGIDLGNAVEACGAKPSVDNWFCVE